MSIPIHLSSFKAAGIYRVVFDKSTIEGTDAEILRMVVGYSEKGPFNYPTYVSSITDFKEIYGDISKKLEKRGVYFHRLALQCLNDGPILCLNLKKFSDETVGASTIDTTFNPSSDPIDTVYLSVEDIYDTTRFWVLDATKLTEVQDTEGKKLDGYISISATNTDSQSASYFIRKASGTKVSAYDVTVNDWYKDEGLDVPEYLQDKLNNKISDFFAEIYVFKGKFTADQVLTSEALKNYFVSTDDGTDIRLRQCVYNAYGDAVDTLDSLYEESTSGALAHYIGCLIPYFTDKQGVYKSLDILFNEDVDTNNLMMSFDIDALDEGTVNIDLSGRTAISTESSDSDTTLNLDNLYAGTATTTLLGNTDALVVTDKVTFDVTYTEVTSSVTAKRISGEYYVSAISAPSDSDSSGTLTLTSVDGSSTYTLSVPYASFDTVLAKLNISLSEDGTTYYGGAYCEDPDFETVAPELLIISIRNYTLSDDDETVIEYTTKTGITTEAVTFSATSTQITDIDAVYDTSVSFIPLAEYEISTFENSVALISTENPKLVNLFSAGDCILAEDNDNDENEGYYDAIYVQETGSSVAEDGTITYYVKLSGTPYTYDADSTTYIIRIDNPLNQEIGIMIPVYQEGYTYQNDKPASTSMYDKLQWQESILSTLTEYKGIRVALLDKAEIDYRYIIDTVETFIESSAKSVLSYLAKEKQSAFAILNFPSVRTFVKCPYSSFTDSKGVFNVEYVVKGYNPKKSHSTTFSLPSDSEGASFCAFYTPLKHSDGYVDTIIPSAGLVSNLFMEKYKSRQPYYIIAGPNYGAIYASNITGPDYKYSQDELQIIEPFGVNCMVYRPGFGTFINANQTAKQTPKSALSSVNVRELVIYLQDEIEKVLQSYQWEFNNATVRNKIKDKADSICTQIQQNGGIQDFLNVMDESNNTPDIIDNEMAVLSTHIEPGRGMGKMVHELTIYRTGQLSASTSES